MWLLDIPTNPDFGTGACPGWYATDHPDVTHCVYGYAFDSVFLDWVLIMIVAFVLFKLVKTIWDVIPFI